MPFWKLMGLPLLSVLVAPAPRMLEKLPASHRRRGNGGQAGEAEAVNARRSGSEGSLVIAENEEPVLDDRAAEQSHRTDSAQMFLFGVPDRLFVQVFASRSRFCRISKRLPCSWLVPDLRMTLTTPPAARPYSAL